MHYRELGKTGLCVSQYCFGSLTLGPLAAHLSLEQGAALLREAFSLGVTFVDTAQYYQTYPYIRLALDQIDNPDRIVIATKTYAQSAQEAAYALEEARLALRRDVIDLFVLHEIRSQEDFIQRQEAWQVLLEAKANGIIRAVGFSTHSAKITAWAAEREDVDVLQCLVNQKGIGIIHGNREEMLAAIEKAKARGKGVFGMKAIGGGALMNEAKESLQWAFSVPNADAFAVGCKDISELRTNLAWLNGQEAKESGQVKLLDRNIVFDKDPYCHGCGRCVAKCAAGAMTMGKDGTAQWEKSKCLYCGYCIGACPWFCISFC